MAAVTPGTNSGAVVTTANQSFSLLSLAKQAGFVGPAAITAAMIAEAESSGNPEAQHTNSNGSVDRGLWQINSVHSEYSPTRLLIDPLYNAQAAFAIYQQAGNSFSPWTTYKSGAYESQSTTGINTVAYTTQAIPGQSTIVNWLYNKKIIGSADITNESTAQQIANAIGTTAQQAVNALPDWEPSWLGSLGNAITSQAFWIKVGVVIAAGIALITGLVIWTGSSKPIQTIAKGAVV